MVGRVAETLGLNQLGYLAQRTFGGPMIRAVNYHGVGRGDLPMFEAHLRYYAGRYDNVTLEQLAAFHAGTWRPRRPGMIISFDDGLRTDYDVVAPALERAGFTGWFFVPVDMIELPPEKQYATARASRITPVEEEPDGRVFMSPAEVRDLAHRHVVGCHTASHVRLSAQLGPERLHAEIVEARARLEAHAGTAIPVFCWVGGEEGAYSRTAATVIRDAGFSYSFMTNSYPIRPGDNPLQLDRTNIEAHYTVPLVGLFLSGVMDVWCTARRRRARRLTDVGRPLATRAGRTSTGMVPPHPKMTA